jgi:hypothetical protein
MATVTLALQLRSLGAALAVFQESAFAACPANCRQGNERCDMILILALLCGGRELGIAEAGIPGIVGAGR